MLKKHHFLAIVSVAIVALSSCGQYSSKTENKSESTFEVEAESFADLQVLRYEITGFDELSAQQKELAFYLYSAAQHGRDIIWDQNYKHNLLIRKTIEGIMETYTGDKNSEDFKKFDIWAKRVWFSNGIHHHYSKDKIMPEFTSVYFSTLLKESKLDATLLNGKTLADFDAFLSPILFDPKIAAKNLNLDEGKDNIVESANNLYEGVTAQEVEDFYKSKAVAGEREPVMYGLNSKLIKENGKIVEKTYKVGGMYSAAIEKIVLYLKKAATVAENAEQKDVIEKLIKFYTTGDLKDFDAYSIAWVKDVNSRIDFVNGFIEVYLDALAKRGSYESVVSMKNMEATKTIAAIAAEAQWFEDNSPLDPKHKKKVVKGITAKVITVITEAGDAAPATPIGINLPNSNWIREVHGSKSVSLGNIIESYDRVSAKSPVLKEFAFSTEIIDRAKKYGALSGALHTDMHEVIGHASGQINPGVSTPDVTLKTYGNCLEEARADLVGLYYIMDKKLVDIGVMPSLEVGKAQYDNYMLNGLMTQLTRIKLGNNLEEAHMRNRQLNAAWAFEKGKAENVVEMVKRDGKTYIKINDYEKLRVLFGQLLKEIQRIKSEGDYASAKKLVETYGVKTDPILHKEVLERYAVLNVAPYRGFIQPKLVPVMKGDKIVDVKVEYPTDFKTQMLEYGKIYGDLPVVN